MFQMKKTSLFLIAFLVAAVSPPSFSQELASVQIQHERFELDNGLRVIVHPDPSALSVKVSIDYLVGSRDEEPGQRGFAHLFEHLMLMRTEHSDDPAIAGARKLGGSANGTTSFDRTNYYTSLPYPALEYAIWLEADRMKNFLNVLNDDALAAQRGVVKNEMRQRTQRVRDEVLALMNAALLPNDHPYVHPTIGNEADLDAASIGAATDWFKRWYGPNNAVLTISGRVSPSEVRSMVEKYFAEIEPSMPPHRFSQWAPERNHNTYGLFYSDDVSSTEIHRAWLMPGNGSPLPVQAVVATDILKGESFSWLHHELVNELQLASDVGMWISQYDLYSRINLRVSLAQGQDIEQANRAIDAVLRRFAEKGPTVAELKLHREKQAASYSQGMRSYGARGDWLAFAERSLGSSDAVHEYFSILDSATPEDMRNVSRDWFGDGYHQVTVLPADWKAVETGVDFSVVPEIGEMPRATVPKYQSAKTSNGVRIFASAADGSPITIATISIDGGIFMDEGVVPGTSDVLIDMMQHATKKHDASALTNRADRLGATIRFNKAGDKLEIQVSTLQSRLEETLAHVVDMLRNPRLDDATLETVLKNRERSLQRLAKLGPMPFELIGTELFGNDHPLGGRYRIDPASPSQVTLADVRKAHTRWIRPDAVQVFISGNTSATEVANALAKPLRGWKSPAESSALAPVVGEPHNDGSAVMLFNRPGAEQTEVLFGMIVPNLVGKEAAAFEVLMSRLSGSFDSRLNMNLREEKGWTYGVKGALLENPGYDIWVTSTSVETGKTVAALEEINDEIQRIRGSSPITAEEAESVINRSVERLNSRFGSVYSRIAAMKAIEQDGQTAAELEAMPDLYRSVAAEDVLDIAKKLFDSSQVAWFIRGDLEHFDGAPVLEELGTVRYPER